MLSTVVASRSGGISGMIGGGILLRLVGLVLLLLLRRGGSRSVEHHARLKRQGQRRRGRLGQVGRWCGKKLSDLQGADRGRRTTQPTIKTPHNPPQSRPATYPQQADQTG